MSKQFFVTEWGHDSKRIRPRCFQRNRIARSREGKEFSHGLHPTEPIPTGIANGRNGGHYRSLPSMNRAADIRPGSGHAGMSGCNTAKLVEPGGAFFSARSEPGLERLPDAFARQSIAQRLVVTGARTHGQKFLHPRSNLGLSSTEIKC